MMAYDKIETISRSLIQHGPHNDRIYLMKIHPEEEVRTLIDSLDQLAEEQQYSKIFAKVPERKLPDFEANGFALEAAVPNFYKGKEFGYFVGKYTDPQRAHINEVEQHRIEKVKESTLLMHDASEFVLPRPFVLMELEERHIPEIADIYKKVFQFYPFPIFDKAYLQGAMQTHVQYFGVQYDGQLVAISSAEKDKSSGNVEMTDFATLPAFRGQNLSYFLLERMMGAVRAQGFNTAYTIARSVSFGMNKTFARHGFQFGGTLVNNTLIGDSIESMNVWYKAL